MSEEMSREQAITELSILLNEYQDTVTGDAIDIGITALEAEPCVPMSVIEDIKAEIASMSIISTNPEDFMRTMAELYSFKKRLFDKKK